MTSIFWNKAGAWGSDGGRVLPINRPGGGLLTSKEVLDLSKEEATYRSGLRGFRRSELEGADLCIHRRGAYFRIEWVLEGRETGWESLEARQSIALLLLQAPKGLGAPWMALETWCRHTGAPGLEDRKGEVKRRVEAYLLAFIEHWQAHPEQRPVMASIAAWPTSYAPSTDGRIDLRASAINLGIQAKWIREEARKSGHPMEQAIADLRTEFAFWAGPFANDPSLRWMKIPSEWLEKVGGWLECTSIDLQGEWGTAYYQGLTLRLDLNRSFAQQMLDYLSEQDQDLDTEFLRAMTRGNPSERQRAAWADQVLSFAGDRESWLAEQVRLSATKASRDANYVSKGRRRREERWQAHLEAREAQRLAHLTCSDEEARTTLVDLALHVWDESCPFILDCQAQLDAGDLDRQSPHWQALYHQRHGHGRSGVDTTIPGQAEAFRERAMAFVGEAGIWVARHEAWVRRALGPLVDLLVEEALGEGDLGTWAYRRSKVQLALGDGKVWQRLGPHKWLELGTAEYAFSLFSPLDEKAQLAKERIAK